jgi:hypothetical protein
MVATGLGYPIVLWDFEFNQHGESPTANLDRTGRATRSGSILLGHDGRTLNCEVVVEVLPPLIDAIYSRGFRVVALSDLLVAGMTRSRRTIRRRCSHRLTLRSLARTKTDGMGQRKDDVICASTSA